MDDTDLLPVLRNEKNTRLSSVHMILSVDCVSGSHRNTHFIDFFMIIAEALLKVWPLFS